jgi:hypothetical protein
MAVDIAGRPTGFSAGDAEQRWKAAVRSAFAGTTVPPLSRVAIEVEYRLDPSQIGHNAPDLDNLLKATIDGLDEILGRRPGRFARPQADDEDRSHRGLQALRPAGRDTGCPRGHR